MNRNKGIILLLVVTSIVSSTLTYVFCKHGLKTSDNQQVNNTSQAVIAQTETCSYNIKRLEGYKYIRPIEYAEPECEGVKYRSLKAEIQNKIEGYKLTNGLVSSSVYFRGFQKGNWMNVNPEEKYHPASLLKLAVLITFLKKEEVTPGLLNRKLTFAQRFKDTRVQTFNSHQIQIGKSYTIKELLEYMVSYSDNNATNLLHDFIDVEEHKRTFLKLGIPVPDLYKLGYTISTKDYSTFLKILFNGGYLTNAHSEFALELLAKTDFNQGLLAGLPEGIQVAHKFGEWTDGNSVRQLHESGIIYLNDKAYLLTVMTSGNNVKKLSEVIAGITKTVYDHLDKSNLSRLPGHKKSYLALADIHR